MVRASAKSDAWGRRSRSTPKTEVELADTATVAVGIDRVLALLRDVNFVAGCLPGLVPGSLTPAADGAYNARMKVSVVGVTAIWELNGSLDAPSDVPRIALTLTGQEPRIRMSMNGGVTVVVRDAGPSGTVLDYRGRVVVEGRVAATGGLIIRHIIDQVLERFLAKIAALGAEQPAPARPAGSLLMRFLRRLWKRRR
jgi:carbon monoxide dehydrogenase subunit G